MKPWNTWVAGLGCAGFSLVLVGCGGSKSSDQGNDPPVVIETLPPAQNAPEPIAPANPAPAAPAAVADAAPAPAQATPTATPEGGAVGGESLAMNKPAPEAATPVEPATKPAEPATNTEAPGTSTPAAAVSPATATPTPAVDPNPNAVNNPFAVFSDTQSTASAPTGAAGTTPPGAAVAVEEPPAEAATAAVNPPPEENRGEDALAALNAAAGDRGTRSMFHTPVGGAMAFLDAVKKKDLNKIAEATALHAPYEARAGNQKVFDAILKKELLPEDLDEFAKKLDGYQFTMTNAAKSTGQLGVVFSKMEGTSIMRRTITMRHEKAGWKVQDISGQGEIEKQIIMPRMRGGMGGRR